MNSVGDVKKFDDIKELLVSLWQKEHKSIIEVEREFDDILIRMSEENFCIQDQYKNYLDAIKFTSGITNRDGYLNFMDVDGLKVIYINLINIFIEYLHEENNSEDGFLLFLQDVFDFTG